LCSHRHSEPFEKPVMHVGTILPITRPVFNNSYFCRDWSPDLL